MSLLDVRGLSVAFQTRRGELLAVDGLSYSLEASRTLAIVGESGSGKSVSAMSLLGLIDPNGRVTKGEAIFDGVDLLRLDHASLRKIRGKRISVIFQEPMTSLDPVFSIQKQLSEPFRLHEGLSAKKAHQKSCEALASVGLEDVEKVLASYPHELSGGMRQRVMIAMALATSPDILIADEPTTALDVTVQAEILSLLATLQKARGTAILFITHDLGVVGEIADDVLVSYAGQAVETVSVFGLFCDSAFSHPYTEGLLASIPRAEGSGRLFSIKGAPPDSRERLVGCRFAPRCPYATALCFAREPELVKVEREHFVRCFYPEKEVRSRGKAF